MRTDCEGSVREPQFLQTAEPTSSSQTVAEPHSLHLTDMQGEENEETAEIEKQERDYPIVVSSRPHSIFAIKQGLTFSLYLSSYHYHGQYFL